MCIEKDTYYCGVCEKETEHTIENSGIWSYEEGEYINISCDECGHMMRDL
jgi:ribosomal protein L37AE/L43A